MMIAHNTSDIASSRDISCGITRHNNSSIVIVTDYTSYINGTGNIT